MTPPRRRALLLALPLALAACSVVPDRPYVEVRRFPLRPDRPGGPAPRGARPRRTLALRNLRAAPGQEVAGLRTLRADGTEAVDPYAEWAAPPAEAMEDAARRWLVASGRFAAVTVPGSRAVPDLVLELELAALHAEPARGRAVAALSAVLLDGAGRRVVAQLTPRGEAPLAAPPRRDGTVPPEAAATAMAAALGQALAALERGIAART